jgi:hypothetical protein
MEDFLRRQNPLLGCPALDIQELDGLLISTVQEKQVAEPHSRVDLTAWILNFAKLLLQIIQFRGIHGMTGEELSLDCDLP